MKKNKMLSKIIYMTMLLVVYSTFFACGDDENPPAECPAPTELGLTNIDTATFAFLTYEWTPVATAQEYLFTLDVNGTEVYTETTMNALIEFEITSPLQDNDVVTASVQTICTDGADSELTTDVFEVDRSGIAAVEVVYIQSTDPPSICNSTCDYVRFETNNTGAFCGDNIYFVRYYYYTQPDFCDCVTNSCGAGVFIDCLSGKSKKVYRLTGGC